MIKTNGSLRWNIYGTDEAESGSDAGSNFVFQPYDDTGSAKTIAMKLSRDGTPAQINYGLYINGPTYSKITSLGTANGTITCNFANANYFAVTLNGTATFDNPTNMNLGQSGALFITQDATGSRTASWGTNWDWTGGAAPVLSTTPGSVDVILFVVRSNTSVVAQALYGVS